MAELKKQKSYSGSFMQEIYNLKDDQAIQVFYAKWAEQYDIQVEQELNYVAHVKVANLLMHYVAERSVKVLDVGCGTGLIGACLAKAGYKNISGLDFSVAMLKKAQERGIYESIIQADLNQPLAIADAKYDAVVSSGTFSCGHVGSGPLNEIFRTIKLGGYFVFTVNKAIWKECGFEEKIDSFSRTGRVCKIEVTPDVYFKGGTPDGLYCVLQKSCSITDSDLIQ